MTYDGDFELAWHFLADDGKGAPVMRDGTPLVVGQWYEHAGALVMCESGFRASTRAIDALQYAPGPWVSLVEVDGTIKRGDDKLVCTRRRALWAYDATEQLRLFARNCALEVAHLWEMPAIVREYFETGKEEIRDAAWAAARDAANAAARDAANAAANAAAWDAARAAARAAAWDAARAAAWAAAWYAARAAAWDAAWAAARAAAWDAAWAAARDHQNATLESMLIGGCP